VTDQPRRGQGLPDHRFRPTARHDVTGLELSGDEAAGRVEQKREERLPHTLAELRVLCDDAAKLAARGRAHFDADWGAKRIGKNLVTEVGETATRLPASYRADHPEIEWAFISGIRNRVVHAYQDTDDGAVWDAIAVDIPDLRRALEL
jgi:hypothetical protein